MKLAISCRMTRHVPMSITEARKYFQCDKDGLACINCRLLLVKKQAKTVEAEGVTV